MINKIFISGVGYKLIDNPNKSILSCDKCDLLSFCKIHIEFIKVCDHINNNNYYKTIKQ